MQRSTSLTQRLDSRCSKHLPSKCLQHHDFRKLCSFYCRKLMYSRACRFQHGILSFLARSLSLSGTKDAQIHYARSLRYAGYKIIINVVPWIHLLRDPPKITFCIFAEQLQIISFSSKKKLNSKVADITKMLFYYPKMMPMRPLLQFLYQFLESRQCLSAAENIMKLYYALYRFI